MTYIPIHVHTCWSLLDSVLTVDSLVSKCKEYKIPAVCMTDHNNIKGVVSFFKECKNNGIKPIIGVELDLYSNEIFAGRITLLAKNKTGYKNIVKIVSMARTKEALSINGSPVTRLDSLYEYRSGLICLIGDIKSQIHKAAFINSEMAYESDSVEKCEALLHNDWKDRIEKIIGMYKKIYDHVFLYYDVSSLPAHIVLGKKIIEEFPDSMPSHNIHYLNKEDLSLYELVNKSKEDADSCCSQIDDSRIFDKRWSRAYLSSSINRGEKTLQLLDLIEDYSIQERPMLPSFKIGIHKINDAHEHLKDLCRSGFKSTGLSEEFKKDPALKNIYVNRIKHELEVFKQAEMSGYFLIVHDIINNLRERGIPADIRGSSSGCMISYLIGISSVDPMRPDPVLGYDAGRELPFERFYNEGRNTKENISLPDIDTDVPPSFRESLIEYIRKKYGNDCVGHIITHSRFKGRGAIKEVFKLIKPVADYFEMSNQITKKFAEEAKISDDLVEMQKEDPSYGIIKWNIDNIKSVAEYYEQFKEVFDYAIQMEKIPKNESVHAAGIIIADQPLTNLFPMVYSKKLDSMIIDVEGADIEYLGGVKFDILGVTALEKVFQIQRMLNFKLNEVEFGEFSYSYYE